MTDDSVVQTTNEMPEPFTPAMALNKMRGLLDSEGLTFDDVQEASCWALIFLAEHTAREFGIQQRVERARRSPR